MIVLLSKVKEGAGNSGIVRDKPMIEIGKAEEGLYFLDLHKCQETVMLSSFTKSIASWPGFTIIPRYSTSRISN